MENKPIVPILVISLGGAEERQKKIRPQIEALGLPFEFFPAIDGRGFDVRRHPAYDSARRRRAFGRDLTNGEIGCLLSHRAIYDKMVAEEIEHVLVLEDDAILGPDFPRVLAALQDCPVPYDMIRFLARPKIARLPQRYVYRLVENYWLSRLPATPGGAYTYLIRLQGAKKLLPYLQRNWLPVDTLMGRSWEHGLQWFTVQPPPSDYDRTLESAIGDVRFDKTLTLTGIERLTYPLTRAQHKLSEAIGKRLFYWSTWPADRRYRKLSGRQAAAEEVSDPLRSSSG